MKIKYSLFFVFLICFGLVFSSCSKGVVDCSTQDTTYKKYSWNSEVEQCVLVKDVQPNVCGNKVAEGDENYCNCPLDDGGDVSKDDPVRGCNGDLGEYLEMSCNINDECVMSQNSKVVSQVKSVELKNSDIVISGDFVINKPLLQNVEDDNRIKVDLDFFKVVSSSVGIENLILKELSIENSAGIKYASVQYNEQAFAVGHSFSTKNVALSEVTKYLARESLRAKAVVSYTKSYYDSQGTVVKQENKIETLTTSLGQWDIINPNFFEE